MDGIRDFITATLTSAVAIANDKFGKVSGAVKSEDNNQVLTTADLEIGKLIVQQLTAHYPDWNIIDEEAGTIDKGSSYTWIVDPIDGTSNFANSLPTYGIMVGLLQNGTPIAGGVALPYFHETYVAEKGKGASCNGKTIAVSQETTLLNSLVAYGIDGHQEDPALTTNETSALAEIILNIRNLRSSNSVYDGMLVARGNYGAWLNRTTKIWDNVAPHIIIEEAGGLYTDFFGNAIDYSDPMSKVASNFTMCAGAPSLHRQLQAIIHNTPEMKR